MQYIEKVENKTDLIAKGHVALWCHARNLIAKGHVTLWCHTRNLIAKGHVTLWCRTRNFPFEFEIHFFEVQLQWIYGKGHLIYSSYCSCLPNTGTELECLIHKITYFGCG
jgi:hypothetical protein